MAYLMTASGQNIQTANAAATTTPITMHCIAKLDSLAVQYTLIGIYNTGFTQYHAMYLNGPAANDPLEAATKPSGSGGVSQSNNYSSTNWNYCGAVYAASNSRTAYLNNVAGTTNTVDATPVSLVKTLFGAGEATANGIIAECAIWDAALTAAEIASLSKGFKPYRVRPQSLVAYTPHIRNLVELVNKYSLTNNNGCTVANHPRVY